MGDLRNKLRKQEMIERQREWLAKHYPPTPPPPVHRCICGLSYYDAQIFCIQADHWSPVLYRCIDHLPGWAMDAVKGKE